MSEHPIISDINTLKSMFKNSIGQNKPFIYFPIDSKDNIDSSEEIYKLFSSYKRHGFGGIIPFSHKDYSITPLSESYYSVYGQLNKAAMDHSLKLSYLDDTYIMREYLSSSPEASCKVLKNYEYNCTESQHITHKIHKTGTLMSVIALNDDDQTIIDLRDFVNDEGILEWTVPQGNWNIEEYVCEQDISSNFIDILDYNISSKYIKETFGHLLVKLSEDNSNCMIDTFIFRNIMFAGENRRMWNERFNEIFEEEYGFDPAVYYPLLFRSFQGSADKYKCMLMSCRAKMLYEGYLKAASDFCSSKDIFCTGFPAEGKATASSWLFGDGQMLHKYSSAPGISMPFAYLYGINGIKVAAGAADALGSDTVVADMFNHFSYLSRDIIYREAMNAYVRGVNMILTHLGKDVVENSTEITEKKEDTLGQPFSEEDMSDFTSFSTRVQDMLRGGHHVCEVAFLYPIHFLHSFVYLYQSANKGFEYPSTPENVDYMDIMNSFLNYVGVDSSFIHPDMLAEKASLNNGSLIYNNGKYSYNFKLLVLPSMSIISLKTLRIIKQFFDDGGKIIATDYLPLKAYECKQTFDDVNVALRTESDEDREVADIIKHIFGESAIDKMTYKQIYKNGNANGGIAYYIPSNTTSADRTDSVSANMLYQAVHNTGIAPDVYIDNMPRMDFHGVVNYHLPAYKKVQIDKQLSKGCSINYIHKKYAGCDIYFITNTTGDKYKSNILIRGYHEPEKWNPHNSEITELTHSVVNFKNNIYTSIPMVIDASSCVFIVSKESSCNDNAEYIDLDSIPQYYPKDNF